MAAVLTCCECRAAFPCPPGRAHPNRCQPPHPPVCRRRPWSCTSCCRRCTQHTITFLHPLLRSTQPALHDASLQAVPLVIGQFLEMVDNNTGIVGSTTGSNYYVRILSTLNRCVKLVVGRVCSWSLADE